MSNMTAGEEKQVNKEQNAASKNIYNKKHKREYAAAEEVRNPKTFQ